MAEKSSIKTHTWKVENFSSLDKLEYGEYFSRSESTGNVQFALKLRPNGIASFWGDHIIVFARLAARISKQKYYCKLSIMKNNGEEWRATNGVISKNILQDGFGSFHQLLIHKQHILQEKDQVLQNDTLIIRCEIGDYVEPCRSAAIHQEIDSLLENPLFSDVKFEVGGKEFPLHKLVLSAQSSVFKRMFQENPRKDKFIISDISADDFKVALEYIYTGKSSKICDYSVEIFNFAQKYKIEALKNICLQEIEAGLCSCTLIEAALLADQHKIVHLKNKCIQFAQEHSVDFFDDEKPDDEDAFTMDWSGIPTDWNKLLAKPKLAIELFSVSNLTYRSVIQILLFADKHGADDLKEKCKNIIKKWQSKRIQITDHEDWKKLQEKPRLALEVLAQIDCTPESVIPILLFADSHNGAELKTKCFEYIKSNTAEVKKQPAWKALKDTNKDLMMELLMELV